MTDTSHCRIAEQADIPSLARLRAERWGTPEYWHGRIARYLSGEAMPQMALAPRVVLVAGEGADKVTTGFIAGHLTRRFGCDGELEWIDVAASHRGQGIATQLLRHLARWFVSQGAARVCVNVAEDNLAARSFYASNGASVLREHWMVWDDIGTISLSAAPPSGPAESQTGGPESET